MSSSAASSSNAASSAIRKSPSPSDASEEMNRSPIVDDDNVEEEDIDLTAEIEEEKKLAKQNGALNARAGISAADWKAMSASDRLDALLKQTTLFSQFVAGSASKAAKSEESGRGRRKAHSEKEEDENLVKEVETDLAQDDQITRLTVQPSSVKAEMRSYQLEALNWLIKLYDGGINGILADEMGLGKTLESLSMLAYLKQFRGIDGPHLVIVPKSTSSNWMREIGRFTPSLTAFKFHGTEEQRLEQKKQLGKTSICVTTYEIAIREKAALRKIDWQYLYIDEAHRIKNEKSLLASIVRTFNSKRRLLITGTPLQNNLHELWALLNFLLPQVFDSADDFAQWFNLEGEDRSAVVQRLHRILRPFILRRLKSEVEKSLPPKVETNLYIGLSAMQRSWYHKILSRELHVISDVRGRKTALLNIVMQLRKVCNHPYLFDGAEPGPPYLEGEHLVENCGKMILLDKLLKRLKETGHRVLIFSQMTRMLDILEDYCRYRGFEYCRIDGQTEQVVRDEQMDTYNAPDSSKFVFLLSTRAGGLGINLQTADTVILYDSDWNPQMDLQAQDRAHRIGQKRQVSVFRFITERTLEEKIVQRANEKLFLDAVVIQQGRLGEKSKVLSANELQDMVRFGASHIFQSKDATITDEDIDAILAKGKERTEEEAAKLKKTVNFNNMNFTSDGFSVNEFEGKDYTALRAQQRAAAGFDFIELSKRERKGGTYDINKYYREALRVSEPKPGKKEWKPTARHDFQFFQSDRLIELERREHDSKVKLKELIDAEKTREKEEKKAAYERAKEERKRKRRAAREEAAKTAAAPETTDGAAKPSADSATPASSSAPAAAGGDTSASGKREAVDTEMTDAKPSGSAEPVGEKSAKNGKEEEDSDSEKDEEMPPADEADDADEKDQSAEAVAKRAAREAKFAELRVQAGCLTEEEIKEKEELLQEGFGNWNKRHFQLYLRACEKYGRGEIDKIKHDVEGKTPEEVETYHVVFWKRGKELPDWSKYLSQIEKGEERLEKLEQLGTVLKAKYDSKRDPFFALDVPYPLKTKQKTFTEEEDRFLICQMHLLGYGQWDEIRKAIRDSWMFRFDWFLKSLKSPEIARRCEYLMKLLQSEYEAKLEEEKAKRAAEAKKKKAQSKKQQKKTPTKGKQTKSPAKGKSPAGKKGKATPKSKPKKGAANRKRKSSDDDEEEDEDAGSESGSDASKSGEDSAGSEQEDGSGAEYEEEEEKPQKKQKTAKGSKAKGTPAKKKGKATPSKKGRKGASDESEAESDEESEEEDGDEKPAKKRKKAAKQPEPEGDSDDDDMVLADFGKDAGTTKEKDSDKEKDKDASDATSPPPSARKIPKRPDEKKKTPSKDGAKPLSKTASSGGADVKAADSKAAAAGDEAKKDQKEEAKPAHVPKIPKKRGR